MLALPFKLTNCSQECGAECGSNITACPVYGELPPEFQELCQTKLHLLQYLQSLPLEEIGMPQLYLKLNRGLKTIKNRNLIYQVDDEIFIHIMANAEEVRDFYIPIEPCLFGDVETSLAKIERSMVNFVEELDGATDGKERLKIILDIVDRLVVVDHRQGKKSKAGANNNAKNTNGRNSGIGHSLTA